MEKPPRRRRRRRPPLPLAFRLPTRLILSHPHPHPHPVRLQTGERGRQIQLSAPVRNISKLKRGRSRVSPRRTCQVITSSSEVEAASMSKKCEIRLEAKPNKSSSCGPGQVAQLFGSSAPQLDLLSLPDEFESLEANRLRPYLKKNTSGALLQYDAYLDWFYKSHRGSAPFASLADAASMCLRKETIKWSLWVNAHASSNIPLFVANQRIIRNMHIVIEEKGETEHPFGIDAALCLAKEAELISEWLRHGRSIFVDDDFALCHNIRVVAAELLISHQKWSFHIAAALVGIRKEAEWLIENLKCNSGKSINTSMKIRRFALDSIWGKFPQLDSDSENESKSKSESESELFSESDDDDIESQDNKYLGALHDEDYLKLYR